MSFCPICHAEYREGVMSCAHCEVELVASLDMVRPKMTEDQILGYLEKRELVPVAKAGYDRLKPIRDLFCKKNIASIILREDGEGCGAGCVGLGALNLMVAEEDIEAAVGVLEEEFSGLVNSVGEDADLDIVDGGRAALDYDEGKLICPACGEEVQSGQNECPECGLYIGIPEE